MVGLHAGIIMTTFSSFNPAAMSREVIEGVFVQREALAERLVDLFEQSARRTTKHNVLLVGPRGIGKSYLTSLVYHRLKEKNEIADRIRIAYLREDEWGINSFLDLLLHILRAVSEDLGVKPSATAEDAFGLDRAQAENLAKAHLSELVGDRTLFVIIENLDAVSEKIGEEGQRQWRALIQTSSQWALLA